MEPAATTKLHCTDPNDERLCLATQHGATLGEEVEDRVDGGEHATRQLFLQLAFALDHLLNELKLALHRLD